MKFGRVEVPDIYFVHAAFAVVILSVGTLMAREMIRGETVPLCSSRMSNGTLFGVESRPGQLLTTEELLSGLAGQDRGVTENLSFATFSDGPSKSGLKVRLAEVKGAPDAQGRTTIASGIDFGWYPRRMPAKTANCLSYNVKLPSDFSFGGGGLMPSFVAIDPKSGAPRFQTKLHWRHDGQLVAEVITEEGGEKPVDHFELASSRAVPLGRWMRIEQEIILNDLDKDNAEVRVWIDEQIVIWHTGFKLRKKTDTHPTGIAAKFGYRDGQQPPLNAAGNPADVNITPFEIRWP